MIRCSLFVLVLGVCSVGCATELGTFKADGFHRGGPYKYEVAYGNADKTTLLNDHWYIENFKDDGKPKDVSAYHERIRVDYNNDGKLETLADKGWAFDLVLDNKTDAGTIWLSTVPVTKRRFAEDPVVVMREIVGDVSGGMYFGEEIFPGEYAGRDRRITSVLRDMRRLKVAGRDAVMATFEIADVDRIQLEPDAREAVVRLVLIKTPLKWVVTRDYQTHKPVWWADVFMVVGYANHPPDFDKHTAEFERFLGQIELKGHAPGVQWPAPSTPKVAEPALRATKPAPPPAPAPTAEPPAVSPSAAASINP